MIQDTVRMSIGFYEEGRSVQDTVRRNENKVEVREKN